MLKKYDSFFDKIKNFFSSFYSEDKIIDINDIDQIEKILLSADVGTKTTIKILSKLENLVENQRIKIQDFKKLLKKEILNLFFLKKEYLDEKIKKSKKPYVCVIVGINGVGKTTTVGKLAFLFKNSGLKPIIGASDTFRECAIEQLEIWANRAGVPLIKQKIKSDPASVAYDTLQSAKSKNKDVILIDTAGRLHNRVSLMEELSKINRVMKKIIPDAPHENILVLDANTGQNAFEQSRKFFSFIKISSLILTKLEGTAKGGFIIDIMNHFKVPIQYVGIGEKINDLIQFNHDKFIDGILQNDKFLKF